jgi:hypothetical protein
MGSRQNCSLGKTKLSFEVTFPLLIETLCSHNVSPQRVVLPEGLPSASITPLQRYYALSDFLAVISAPLLLHLSANTSTWWKNCQDLPRSPICFRYVPCSMTPEAFCIPAHHGYAEYCFRITRHPQPPQKELSNGAQSLQPDGLRPAASLSTLNLRCYQHKPKTRYRMRWVNTFPVALSATSR